MTISVQFSSYTPEQYRQVLDHYNSIKLSHHMPIENWIDVKGDFKFNSTKPN